MEVLHGAAGGGGDLYAARDAGTSLVPRRMPHASCLMPRSCLAACLADSRCKAVVLEDAEATPRPSTRAKCYAKTAAGRVLPRGADQVRPAEPAACTLQPAACRQRPSSTAVPARQAQTTLPHAATLPTLLPTLAARQHKPRSRVPCTSPRCQRMHARFSDDRAQAPGARTRLSGLQGSRDRCRLWIIGGRQLRRLGARRPVTPRAANCGAQVRSPRF